MPLILAEKLDTLTVQDLQEWDRRAGDGTSIVISVIDERNLTLERQRRLQSLVHQRDEPSESHAVNADELTAKLRQISPRRPPTPSDTASTPTTAGGEVTEEEHIEFMGRIAHDKYKGLKDMGSRPSREIIQDHSPCSPSRSDADKRYHVRDHWGGEVEQVKTEMNRWLDFRWHQFKMRENSQKFNKYEEAVRKHQEETGTDWAVELLLSRQTKLDEWREYYMYEHRKRRALEQELDRAKRELEPVKERVTKAKHNGSVGVPPTALSGRGEELGRYDERILRAQKEVDTAQKRLEVSRAEESLSPYAREMMITQAEEELESAQKRLEAEKSDELEQLNKEAERINALESPNSCTGKR